MACLDFEIDFLENDASDRPNGVPKTYFPPYFITPYNGFLLFQNPWSQSRFSDFDFGKLDAPPTGGFSISFLKVYSIFFKIKLKLPYAMHNRFPKKKISDTEFYIFSAMAQIQLFWAKIGLWARNRVSGTFGGRTAWEMVKIKIFKNILKIQKIYDFLGHVRFS